MCFMLSDVPLVYGMTICPMDFLVVLSLVIVLGRLLLFVGTIVFFTCTAVVVAVCGPCILLVVINTFVLYTVYGPVRIFALAKGSS